jgi:hypothetical protein
LITKILKFFHKKQLRLDNLRKIIKKNKHYYRVKILNFCSN